MNLVGRGRISKGKEIAQTAHTADVEHICHIINAEKRSSVLSIVIITEKLVSSLLSIAQKV